MGRIDQGIKDKIRLPILLILCLLSTVFLKEGFCFGNTGQESGIDVMEKDGLYVTWRENDCYQASDSLYFCCRQGYFRKVLVSKDDGRNFRDATSYFLGEGQNVDRLKLTKEMTGNEQICIRFITHIAHENFASRDYRVRF